MNATENEIMGGTFLFVKTWSPEGVKLLRTHGKFMTDYNSFTENRKI